MIVGREGYLAPATSAAPAAPAGEQAKGPQMNEQGEKIFVY